ncbi:nuclear matrix constituent protein 1-like protein [Dorcoceras hygrometricum]|uniref:Nuclear matrix constituent protein 1-like protein n=1 Tax=Dorcoceras hygrometricum TaxID=472368 RepID=A0A2Z7B8F6_9LAMI|nr:nuclear matrix constituent protein 1-like protein [Dorcoceras hygrometricum]
MQHANNQCYEMHVAVKGNRSTRLVYQPAKHIKSPQYHGLSTGKSSGPISPSQLGGRHSYSVVTAPMIVLDWLKLQKQNSKYKGLLTQTFTLAEGSQISRHEDTRQLRVPPPALIQGSKWVANERAKQGPISEENNTDHQGPTPSTLQMVVYTTEIEDDTRIYFLEDYDSSHAGSQQMFISSPPASPHAGSKLKEVEKIVASLDSRIMSIDSRMLSMDSRHTPKRACYDKIDTVSGNVKSSQTSLKTTVLHHLTEHQIQLASDLGFVKIQLVELVVHLKKAGDAKKGEGGQSGSRPWEGSGRQGEGPNSTSGKGSSPRYRRGEDSNIFLRGANGFEQHRTKSYRSY